MRIKILIAVLSIISVFLKADAGRTDPFLLAKANAIHKGMPVLVEFVSKESDNTFKLNKLFNDAEVRTMLDKYFFRGPFVRSTNKIETAEITEERYIPEENSYTKVTVNPYPGVMRIAVEDYPELAESMRIKGLPQYIIISPEGKIAARREGMLTVDEMTDFLEKTTTLFSQPTKYETYSNEENEYIEPSNQSDSVKQNPQELSNILWKNEPPREPAVTPSAVTSPADVSSASSSSAVPVENKTVPHTSSIPSNRTENGKFTDPLIREILFERRFDSPVLWKLQLSTVPADFDLDLEILDPDGKSLIVSEKQTGDENIVLAAADDVIYTVRIYSYKGDPTGIEYELQENFESLSSDKIVPGLTNTFFADANGASFRILRDGDYWVRLSLTPPSKYKFIIDQSAVTGGTAEALVIASDGTLLGTIDGGKSEGVIEVPYAGRVFMLLRPGSGAPKGMIQVKAERYTAIDGSVNLMISPGQKVLGRIGGTDGNQNVYLISGDGGRYELNLTSRNEQLDIDMEVVKKNGEVISRAETPSGSEKLVIDLEDDVELFARVYIYRNDQPVSYILEMKPAQPESVENNTTPQTDSIPAVTQELTEGTVNTSSIGNNESKWYKIEPDVYGLISIFLDAEESEDIDLAFYDSNGTQIVVSQSNFPREAILSKVSKTETYYIKVYAYGESQGGEYRVWYQRVR